MEIATQAQTRCLHGKYSELRQIRHNPVFARHTQRTGTGALLARISETQSFADYRPLRCWKMLRLSGFNPLAVSWGSRVIAIWIKVKLIEFMSRPTSPHRWVFLRFLNCDGTLHLMSATTSHLQNTDWLDGTYSFSKTFRNNIRRILFGTFSSPEHGHTLPCILRLSIQTTPHLAH